MAKPPRTAREPLQTPKLLYLHEVADVLSLSVTTVRRMLKSGELRGMRIAGQPRVSIFDLRAYLRAQRAIGVQAAPALTPGGEECPERAESDQVNAGEPSAPFRP